MEVRRNASNSNGPAEWFTGDVSIRQILPEGDGADRVVAVVRFAPGARTAWHSHSSGQTLHVTDGSGLVQAHGGRIVTVKDGDVVVATPNEWHWHGATATQGMTHIAVTEGDATWGAEVTDDEVQDGLE